MSRKSKRNDYQNKKLTKTINMKANQVWSENNERKPQMYMTSNGTQQFTGSKTDGHNMKDIQHQKKVQIANHSHKVVLSSNNVSNEQRQQITSLRVKRDKWISDLEDMFNKIHLAFIDTLELVKQLENRMGCGSKEEKINNKQERTQLRSKLRTQMKEINRFAISVSDQDDPFLHLQDNLLISHCYKSQLMEMQHLLSIILKLQLDNRHLNTIKIQKRNFNQCSIPLSDEIKRSYNRVQRLKAGTKLGKIINDEYNFESNKLIQSKNNYNQMKNKVQPSLQQISERQTNPEKQDASFLSQTVRHEYQDTQKSCIEQQQPIFIKETQKQNHSSDLEEDFDGGVYDPYSNKEPVINSVQNFDIDKAIKKFNEKRNQIHQMTQKFIENVDKPSFNFDEKYKNFKEYFTSKIYIPIKQLNLDNKLLL